MNRGIRAACIALVAASLGVSRPALAGPFELTPFLGVVHPTRSEYYDLAVPLVIDVSSGAAYGLRATWWTMPRLGLEASMAGSGLEYHLVGNAELISASTLFQADGRARIRLNGPAATNHFDLIGGVGVSKFQSSVDDVFIRSGLSTKARVAWIAGLGATIPLFANNGLRIDFEDHIHDTHIESTDPAITGIPNQSRTLNDLMFTMGVVVPLGGK